MDVAVGSVSRTDRPHPDDVPDPPDLPRTGQLPCRPGHLDVRHARQGHLPGDDVVRQEKLLPREGRGEPLLVQRRGVAAHQRVERRGGASGSVPPSPVIPHPVSLPGKRVCGQGYPVRGFLRVQEVPVDLNAQDPQMGQFGQPAPSDEAGDELPPLLAFHQNACCPVSVPSHTSTEDARRIRLPPGEHGEPLGQLPPVRHDERQPLRHGLPTRLERVCDVGKGRAGGDG